MSMTINWKVDVIPRVQKLLDQYPYAPTVRAIFYRLVSDEVIPNKYDVYKGLIQALNTAREKESHEDGYISVYSFADDTRFIEDINDTYWTPEEYVDVCVNDLKNASKDYFKKGYLPRWHNQRNYIEVMIEKNALRGAFKYVLSDRQVRIVPNNGWSSKIYKQTTIDRLANYSHGHNGEGPKRAIVLYFGDYDPSGIGMSKNIERELALYGIDFVRIGLSHGQISEFGLDHLRNPDPDVMQKLKKDPNADDFRRDNNGELFQIELDALQKSPEQFRQLVLEAVERYYEEYIHKSNLSEFTPESIHELINAKIRFL
jgi:hypothetical protein